jgi:hypothetical protein
MDGKVVRSEDWCNKRVCNMVGKTLETLYSTFFTWCCFPYVHFWELYLSCVYCLCVFVVLYVYCTRCIFSILMFICCTLCVFFVPYVYLLYYVCIAVLTLDAGLLVRSQYPDGPATDHLDTAFSWFPCVYKRMLGRFPSFQVATTCLSCSPPDFSFLVFFSPYLCTCKITTATG